MPSRHADRAELLQFLRDAEHSGARGPVSVPPKILSLLREALEQMVADETEYNRALEALRQDLSAAREAEAKAQSLRAEAESRSEAHSLELDAVRAELTERESELIVAQNELESTTRQFEELRADLTARDTTPSVAAQAHRFGLPHRETPRATAKLSEFISAFQRAFEDAAETAREDQRVRFVLGSVEADVKLLARQGGQVEFPDERTPADALSTLRFKLSPRARS